MFKAIEEALLPVVASFNEYLSSYILIALLVGVGLWFTIHTRAVQVRYFGEGMKRMLPNIINVPAVSLIEVLHWQKRGEKNAKNIQITP